MQTTKKVTYSTSEAAAIAGIGRTTLYSAIGRGDLIARKIGDRTIILKSDLDDWLANLPKANLGGRK